jgi:hypothetical protein
MNNEIKVYGEHHYGHHKGETYLGNFYLKQAINVTTQ